jgi:hypothetical protein
MLTIPASRNLPRRTRSLLSRLPGCRSKYLLLLEHGKEHFFKRAERGQPLVTSRSGQKGRWPYLLSS